MQGSAAEDIRGTIPQPEDGGSSLPDNLDIGHERIFDIFCGSVQKKAEGIRMPDM